MKNQANGCKKPKIIVFTYAYNVEKYIKNALQSMIYQTYDNWEWYLTDNASTDQTPAIIESFLQAHPDERIHYLKRKYNSILQPGKEKDPFFDDILPSFVGKDYYITSLDSDDYFAPDALEIMATPVIEHGVDYVITGRQAFSAEGHYPADLPVTRLFPDIADLSDVWSKNYICMRTVWGKLFRLDGYYATLQNQDSKGISNGLDTYTNLLYMQMSSSAASVGKVTVHFCIRPDSIFNSNVFPERYRAYVKIYQKTIELFRKWNRMRPSNLLFAAQVFQSSIIETIAPTTRDVNAPQALQLIENILTDETVYQVLNQYHLYDPFLETTFSLLQKNAVFPEGHPSPEAEQYFHMWVLLALQKQAADPNDWYGSVCCLLRAVLAENNRYHVGLPLLHEQLKSSTDARVQSVFDTLTSSGTAERIRTNRSSFCAAITRDRERLQQTTLHENGVWAQMVDPSDAEQAQLEQYRQTALNALQSGDLASLDPALEQLARFSPFDYGTIYAKIYQFCLLGQLEDAACVASLIEYLYPYNPLLVDTAIMVFEETGRSAAACSVSQKHLPFAREE